MSLQRRRPTLPVLLSILSFLGLLFYPHRGTGAQIRDYDYASTMITGYVQVKSTEGLLRPVTGADVLLYQTDVRSKKPGWRTITGSSGEFVFVGLPKFATFRIVATAPSIQPASQDNIRLNRSRSTEIKLVAAPSESISERKEEPVKATPPIGNDKEAVPSRGVYNHSIGITTAYDKFKDKTTVVTELMPAGASAWFGNDTLRLAAAFSYTGQTFKMPEAVGISFFSTSKDWKFLTNRGLIILADGERFDLQQARRIISDVSGGSVTEGLVAEVPLGTFLKIVNSTKVEFQLGSVEFELTQERLETLRDLASRLRP